MKHPIWVVLYCILGLFPSILTSQSNNNSASIIESTEFHGRIHYDLNFVKTEDSTQNSSQFRRIRLSLSGKLATFALYKIQMDLHTGAILWRDVYFNFQTSKYGDIAVGNKLEPTSLSMLTGSNYISFIERSNLINLHGNLWGTGLHYSNFNFLHNHLGIQMAYTLNGSSSMPLSANEIDKEGNLIFRLSSHFGKHQSEHPLYHVGLNAEIRKHSAESIFQISYYPGNFSGMKIHQEFIIPHTALQRNAIGLEGAIQFHSLIAQMEYKDFTIVASDAKYAMNAYYASLSYFIGGHKRKYKDGAFGRINMDNTHNQLGRGALELVIRYAGINSKASRITFQDHLINGNTQNITAGINWYLNRNIRLMYNFEYCILEKIEANNNLHVNSHMIRLQGSF